MSKMFRAFSKMLRKEIFSFSLENMRLVIRNTVPKFRFSFMKIVDRT